MMLINRAVVLFTFIYLFLNGVENFSSKSNTTKPISCHINPCKSPPENYTPVMFPPASCKCDADCISYGDCCLDAPAYNVSSQIRNAGKAKCVYVDVDVAVYAQTNCKREWENTTISSLCASASPSDIYNQRDILLSFPVTSNATNVTYPNYYCAVCNDDTESLQPWEGEMKCEPKREDMEEVLDFFQWEKYDSEYKNLLLNNGNVRAYIGSFDILKMMSEIVEVQSYIKSNLIFSEEDSNWIVLVNHHGREIKLTCGIHLHKFQNARDCVKAVQSCPSDPKFKRMNDICQSYVYFVYDRSTDRLYRNPHCAECNNVAVERLGCYYGFILRYIPHLLSILLSVPNTPGKIAPSSSPCGKGKTFLPGYSSCQSTLCRLSNEIHRNGVCLDTKRLSSFYSTTNNSSKVVEFDGLSSSYSKKSLTHETNVSTCNGSWYYVKEINFMQYNNNIISYLKENDEEIIDHKKYEEGYLVCIKHSIHSEILNWISFACLTVSVCCLSLHLFVFILLNTFRNLAGRNLASFAMCLLVAYVVFLASPSVSTNTTNCYVTACIIYFCFFASFCWMNIIAFDAWDSFRTVTSRLFLRRGDQKKRFLLYSLYCWSMAVVAVICLVVTDQSEPQGLPSYFYPSLGQKRCWFGHNMSLLMFFVAPSFVFILLNIFFFVSTAWNILGSKALPEENIISLDRNLFKVHGRLAVLMSIAWVSGIIAYFVNDDIAWCIFIILTSLQGAFIFVAFTCNKTVWCEVLEVLSCSPKTPPKPQKTIVTDDDGNQEPYRTPRIELIHTSSFIDSVHQPSRLAQ